MSSTHLTTRGKYLWKVHRITEAIYREMLAVYGGRCWICRRLPKPGKNLAVDHDHRSQQRRGLLCWTCNKRLIGRSRREHSAKYLAAYLYLESTKDWRVV